MAKQKKRVEKQLVRDWRDKTIFWVGNYDASLRRTFCRFFQSDWRDKGRGFEPARDTSELVFPFVFFLSLHSKTTKQTMHVVIKSNDPQVWTCSFLIMPLFKITGRRSPRVRGNRKYPKTL